MDFGPLYNLQEKVVDEIKDVIGLSNEQLMREGVLVPPGKAGICDFVINISKLNMFRKENYIIPKKKPAEIAKMWVNEIAASSGQKESVIGKIISDGSYINITLNTLSLTTEILNYNLPQEYDIGNDQKVYVEYSSPNIAKPFHAGHLRSTIIGSFLCKLHKKMGFDVVSENYLGDWGKQYGLLALAFDKYGDNNKLTTDPIKHLFEIYVKINQEVSVEEETLKTIIANNPTVSITNNKVVSSNSDAMYYVTRNDNARAKFKQMEEGDEEVLALWRKMRALSIEEYRKIYKRLNVVFDFYGGESKHKDVSNQLQILQDRHLLQSLDENFISKYVEFPPPHTNLGKILLTKKDGSTLYIARDLAAAASRWEKHNFSKMIYVVAVQQDLHFQQLFKMLEMMGYDWHNRCQHVSFGMVKGMSTRKGTVVFLTDILDEAKEVMLEQMKASDKSKFSEIADPETVADIVGMSAVFIQDMSGKREKGYTFDWQRVTSFEGDTGPYLQYAHARLCSIERKYIAKYFPDSLDVEDVTNLLKLEELNLSLLKEEEAHKLAYQIGRYSYAIHNAYRTLEPSAIVSYLFNLCHAISSANAQLHIVNAESEAGKSRMMLFHKARVILGEGLTLLGLKPLEMM
jgi:arginyl-tRNA synthetase